MSAFLNFRVLEELANRFPPSAIADLLRSDRDEINRLIAEYERKARAV